MTITTRATPADMPPSRWHAVFFSLAIACLAAGCMMDADDGTEPLSDEDPGSVDYVPRFGGGYCISAGYCLCGGYYTQYCSRVSQALGMMGQEWIYANNRPFVGQTSGGSSLADAGYRVRVGTDALGNGVLQVWRWLDGAFLGTFPADLLSAAYNHSINTSWFYSDMSLRVHLPNGTTADVYLRASKSVYPQPTGYNCVNQVSLAGGWFQEGWQCI
jgi:hypothetical protein